MTRGSAWAVALCTALASAALAWGRGTPPDVDRSTIDPSVMRIDETRYLGARLDGETLLVDGRDGEFRLDEWLGKPVIVLFSYYGCDGACPAMSASLAAAIGGIRRFRLGEDYRVLTVSFDWRDTPEAAAEFLFRSGAIAEGMRNGWRHAVLRHPDMPGAGAEDFAASVGVRFFWSNADGMFLHPNALIFLTPEGRVARYLYGTPVDPRTVELALIDADWGRISNSTAVFDMLTGACFSYNHATGSYQLNYSLAIGMASWALGIMLMIFGALLYRRRIRKVEAQDRSRPCI